MKKGYVFLLFIAAPAILTLFRYDFANIEEPQPVTYHKPVSYHNFNYNYDYEYSFTLPPSAGRTATTSIGRNIVLAAIVESGDLSPYRQFVTGMQQEAKKNRAGLIVYELDKTDASVASLIDNIIQENIDAIILFIPETDVLYSEVKRLKQANIPVVTIWDSINPFCVDLIDTFVGLNSTEKGIQLARGLAQSFDLYDKDLLLVAGETEAEVAGVCENKLRQSLEETSVETLLWDEKKFDDVVFSENQELILVSLTPEITEEVISNCPIEPVTILSSGEAEKVRELGNSGLIGAGLHFSRQADGEMAVLASIQTARGIKCPIRMYAPTEMTEYE